MSPVLAVFIDGLKPESIKHMEFLNTLENARIKTELGAYSSTCDTSIYTGVFPSKHLCWFTWKYSPNTSPFKILNKTGISRLPHNIYSKYLCYKACLRLSGGVNPGIFSSPFLVDLHMNDWAYFDTDIKRGWEEPGFYGGYPNLFQILTSNRIRYKIVGTKPRNLPDSSKVIKKHLPKRDVTFINYFIGDIDHRSHKYGQDSPETIRRLKTIDKILEEKYSEFKKLFNNFCFIVFSDHGHTEVRNAVNLERIFREAKEKLQSYVHFVDSNYARFWFRDPKEKAQVQKVLSTIGDKGFILTEEHFKKYHIEMPDKRYGDLIFYLDKPNFFSYEISTFVRKVKPPVSVHGYLPDYPDSDAVFISNRKLKKDKMLLQDITPSILQALGLKIPDYMDGEPVWG